jgi:phosphate:Na+ symporter
MDRTCGKLEPDIMISQLLGGIGLFLLGVFLLTDGLKTAAGDKLRRIIVRFTGRPMTAFFSGTAITTLVQSSSATTLATIGFVSAGILTFSQAIGVVMGASLGTTTTGWLVALVGFKYGISKLAFPLVGLGALGRLMSHGRNAAIALAVAGFGVMFAGIDILQSGMADLSGFLSPDKLPHGTLVGRVLLVGIGILLTIITQSSAAAVATTLTAFHAGMIGLEQGTSLIIGASIGTTSASALAAIGATTPARRTALAHILFSVAAGVLAFMLIPAFVRAVHFVEHHYGFQFGAVILAAFHSGFTLLAALLILPGVNRFSAVVERLIPERGPTLTRHLDASLVEVPEVAMEAVRRTLMDVFVQVLDEIEQRLQNVAPATPDRLAVVQAALTESRRFLGTVPSPTAHANLLGSRISLIHALDHLNQLANVVNHGPAAAASDDGERLEHPRQLLLELLQTARPWLERKTLAPVLGQLQRLSAALAEWRRTERRALLEENAHSMAESGETLATLDNLRWLDTVGYHTWRTLHHLQNSPELETGDEPMSESRHELPDA